MGNQLCDSLLITYCSGRLKNTRQVRSSSNWNLEMWAEENLLEHRVIENQQ